MPVAEIVVYFEDRQDRIQPGGTAVPGRSLCDLCGKYIVSTFCVIREIRG